MRQHLAQGTRAPAGAQLLSRSHPLVVEPADDVAMEAISGLEPELAAPAHLIVVKQSSRTTARSQRFAPLMCMI